MSGKVETAAKENPDPTFLTLKKTGEKIQIFQPLNTNIHLHRIRFYEKLLSFVPTMWKQFQDDSFQFCAGMVGIQRIQIKVF